MERVGWIPDPLEGPMNATLFAVIYGLAGILFILAVIFTIRPLRLTPMRLRWLPLTFAVMMLAVLAMLRVYAYFESLPIDLLEWANAVIILTAAVLALLGLQLVGGQSVRENEARAALRKEADLFRQGFDKIPQIVVIKDRQGAYMYTNPAYHQFLGKKDLDLTGETDFKFFPRAQANSFKQEEEKALETNAVRTRDEEIHGIDGTHWLRMARTPLQTDAAGEVGLLVTAQDITTQKMMDGALAGLKNDLKTLEEAEKSLVDALESSDGWENLLSWAEKIAGANHGGVWQVQPEKSAAQLKTANGKLASLLGSSMKMGEGLVWKTWQGGEPQLLNNYASWSGRGQWMRDAGFAAALGLPLKVKNQGYVLALFSDQPGYAFRDDQLQLLSIFSLLVANRMQNAERSVSYQSELDDWRRKQEAFQYRLRLEHILAVISSHFINIDADKVDEGITRSLQTIAKYTGVDRCYLALFPGDGAAYDSGQPDWYTSWTGTTLETRVNFASDDFAWYMNRLTQIETIHIPRINDLTQENEEAAAYLQTRKVKSFTAIPLVFNRSAIGYLGLETLRSELEWPPEILALLKVSAEVFVNLLERRSAALKARGDQQTLLARISSLEQLNTESGLMSEMGDLLQACRTSDEAYPILIRYVQRLIPIGSGALYMMQDAKDPAEKVAAWGSNPPSAAEHEMGPNECWSLRRGRIYLVDDPASEPVCGHIKEPIHSGYMCVPLIAQGVAVGVLHLRLPEKRTTGQRYSENQQRLAAKIGEYIAVPLMNLKLRDDLRSQAIRDPLTGLFNRRYMEETLVREVRRASRHSTSVGIIMFDIDKMKPVNDRFGHDAGDLVLKALGRELLNLFRGEDVACRYGGDEFTIVLPEATLADVWRRAEQMRELVKKLNLVYDGKQLGPLTLSIGVAAYPDHGQTAERVLLASDAASYASKSEGGDRIMMGHKTEA
jgi:diguanylate cyclase (GGDEF)-like protein/PAS domain S-box-containing protein